jgi:hypothetical protein
MIASGARAFTPISMASRIAAKPSGKGQAAAAAKRVWLA